jgi:hypothetical protein
MGEITCKTCPYFCDVMEADALDWAHSEGYDGHCRHDPVQFVGDKSSRGYFPLTGASMWCGKHPEFPV